MNHLRWLGIFLAAILAMCGSALAQSWQPLANRAPFAAGVPLLLTDGTVLVQNMGTASWWKLKPDASGSYLNGTWTQAANSPAGYAPLYFASAVLADGRVIVFGGEYINLSPVWSNRGAIYDPVADTWTEIPAPPGWANIGDAQCVVLPDGRFMIGNPFDARMAILDPVTLTWSIPAGSGKTDRFDEEGWTLMPDGTLLTVDAINNPAAEKYVPNIDAWITAGATPQSLVNAASQEMGPLVLRPDGTVLATGATGHNAVYFPGATSFDPGSWVAAPDFPIVAGQQLDIADGPACLLPSGNVLCGASPGIFGIGTHFFEFNGTNFVSVPDTPAAAGISSYVGNMLLLPTGQVLYTDFSNGIEIYTPAGVPQDAWRPTITNCPTSIATNQSFVVTGTQFNGLSQGSSYGDDATNATNYPLVRLTNVISGHVSYCRTANHSTMAVATGTALVSTTFAVPADAEVGANQLEVVTNGIASAPVTVILGTGTGQPVITSISPNTLPANSPTFTLVVNGIQFTDGDVVVWSSNGVDTDLATTVNSNLVVNATVPASLIVDVNPASVSVRHPDGRVSNGVAFTLTTPLPVLTSLSPSSVTVGSPTVVVTINGSLMMNGALVEWRTSGGTRIPLASTWLSSTQMTATIPATLLSAIGRANIGVTNPGGAGATTLQFLVTGPVSIKSVSPSTLATGQPGTLTIKGAGFVSGAQVLLGNTLLTATVASATQLTASYPASAVPTTGTLTVQVLNPDGGVSAPASVTVANGNPKVTSLTPTSILLGSPTFTLTVNGTNFVSHSQVRWSGTNVVTTFVNNGQLRATIPASLFPKKGNYSVTVQNPSPGGGGSNSLSVSVN